MVDLSSLPGGDLVATGLADLHAGRGTIAALVVTIGASRLRRQSILVPDDPLPDPELRLYAALCAEDADTAYGRYNALIRELTSCAAALEAEEGRALRAAAAGRPAD